MGRRRGRRKRSLGGGCGGWNEGGKRRGTYMFGAIFFTTNWEEFAALGVHTSSPSLPHG